MDEALLKLVQSYFGGVGGFSQWNNNILYRVSSLKDINNVIIPPPLRGQDKYPLLTQKRADYLLFKSVVQLMNNKEHLTSEGLIKIISIKASINNGLSSVLTEAFPPPSITPFVYAFLERPHKGAVVYNILVEYLVTSFSEIWIDRQAIQPRFPNSRSEWVRGR